MKFYDAFVFKVKADILSLSGVPCRHQCWSGWPDGVTDEVCILNYTALYQSLTLGDLAEGLITELLSSEVDSPAASCVSDILVVSVLSKIGS